MVQLTGMDPLMKFRETSLMGMQPLKKSEFLSCFRKKTKKIGNFEIRVQKRTSGIEKSD